MKYGNVLIKHNDKKVEKQQYDCLVLKRYMDYLESPVNRITEVRVWILF